MHDRILQLERFIGSVSPNWDQVAREIDSHIDGLIMSLIAQNNEETRGKIKALRDLLLCVFDMPVPVVSPALGMRMSS